MVDVVVSSDNLVVVGGPTAIDVSVDVGTQGQRGSFIFTGQGKPSTLSLQSIQANDLFINLSQSDDEYLYLYQYGSVNGVMSWSKLLRLVPNTVLVNPVISFIGGEAHTILSPDGVVLYIIKGLLFPLSSVFSDGVVNISAQDINIQYNIHSDKPISSALNVIEVGNSFNLDIYDPLSMTYSNQDLDISFMALRANLSATELNLIGSDLVNTPISGYRTVHFLATLGGKSSAARYFNASDVNNTNNTISIPNHGAPTGTVVVYLNNGNPSISGLVNEQLYFINSVNQDNIEIMEYLNPTQKILIDASSTTGTHTLAALGGGIQ